MGRCKMHKSKTEMTDKSLSLKLIKSMINEATSTNMERDMWEAICERVSLKCKALD